MKTQNVIRAFSAEHVMKLTGLTPARLEYWDKTGFFKPRFADENRRIPNSRIYSFKDVVGLKTLALLRDKYKVSLQHLREVSHKLSYLDESLWSSIRLYVLNRRVNIEDPATGIIVDALTGQGAIIPLVEVINSVSQEAMSLKSRDIGQLGRIERNRYVAHNATVISGTRIPTRSIYRFVKAGYSIQQILDEYPSLKIQDVEAAILHEEKAG